MFWQGFQFQAAEDIFPSMKPFNASGVFCSVSESDKLGHLAVRGAAATVTVQSLVLVMQLLSTVIMARLLKPSDFGVVGMVTTFSLLLMSFGGNGFTEAILQCEKVDQYLASNLFWITVTVGSVLTVGFAASGSLLAKFYRYPLVAPVTVALSVTVLMAAAAVMHLALLRRAMRFSAVAANDLVARASNTLLSIVLAMNGWGHWALVWGIVIQGLSTAIGAWWLCRWIPSLPRRGVGTRPILGFAASVFGKFIMNYLARNCDNALVGWRFTADALGFYKKAYDLFALPAGQFLNPVSSVAVATLSRVKGDINQFRRYVLDSAGIMTFLGMALGTVLTLTGPELIRLVLGPGWERAGNIFAYFGPGIGIMFLHGTHSWIHLSIGCPERWLRWGIFEFGFTFLLFLLGLRWGPEGVALAWTVSFWVVLLPALWYAGRPIGLGPLPFISVVWRYILAAAVAACVCRALVGLIHLSARPTNASGALVRVFASVSIFVLLYLSGVAVLHGGFDPFRRMKRLASAVARSRKNTPTHFVPVPTAVEATSGTTNAALFHKVVPFGSND